MKIFETENNKLNLPLVASILLIIGSLSGYFFFTNRFTDNTLAKNNNLSFTDIDRIPVSKATPVYDMAKIIRIDEIDLRSEPTSNSKAVGTVREGQRVEVLERSRCTDSSAALMSKKFDISKEEWSKTGWPEIHLKKGAPLNIVRMQNGFYICSIKENPNYGYLRLAPNEIIRMNNTIWFRVKADNNSGWLYSDFVSIE